MQAPVLQKQPVLRWMSCTLAKFDTYSNVWGEVEHGNVWGTVKHSNVWE